jgi:nicotinamidase-related amidase
MPIDMLDPRAALLVIDLQHGTLANPTVHPVDEIVAKAAELVGAFRARGLPVVLASVEGTPGGRNDYGGSAREYPSEFTELAPELDQQPEDVTITRRTWSAFAGTDLDGTLSALGVTQVVIVGVATSFGVESTARHAYDHGYNVVLATDAITDLRAEAHENSVTRIFPLLGQTGTTAEIIASAAAAA